ncbi:MAG: DNA polymerase I [Chloroflexi bacterium]|nr:DNA polymerase I [Chloroflexota bacterium]
MSAASAAAARPPRQAVRYSHHVVAGPVTGHLARVAAMRGGPHRRADYTAGVAAVRERPLLVLLDSHGIIYRSFYALRDVLTVRRTGESVAAVFGYANSLLHVLAELRPTYVIAAWDGPQPTFRHEVTETYKATRVSMPDDLRPQIARVRQLLEAFRIPIIEAARFEADDVVGTLTTQAVAQGVDVVIVTLDNDLIQLVQPGVTVYMYRPYQRDYVLYDETVARDRWGFEPRQIVDYKALVGDTSDNIPGVRGIGEKGAAALIQQWGSVEAMLDHLDEVTPARAQKALREGEEAARQSKQLATIVSDVPGVTLDLEPAAVRDYDREAVLELFRELEFRSLVSRLPEHVTDPPYAEPRATPVAPPAKAGTYEVVMTPERLAEVVAELRMRGRAAIELVADAAHPMRAADCLVGFGLSVEAGQGWYLPFGHTQAPLLGDEGTPAPFQLAQEEVLAAIVPVIADPAFRLVAHNGKNVQLPLAEARGGRWIERFDFDTMVAAYLLGDANATVRGLAFDRLGHELVEPKVLLGTGRKAITFAQTEPAQCPPYAAGNADLALRLADALAPELVATHVDGVFADIDLPHIPVLARMERWGVAIDVDALREHGAALVERIVDAERAVYAAVGHEFQIGSPQQLSVVLFEELGLPRTRKTATGWTTDADALEALRDVHPAVDAVLQWRELTKIKSTYLDTLPLQVNPHTGRVHTVFSQVTAATGRLSSNDPNLQNIPVRTEVGNAVRRAFVARGCGADPVFLSFDYSQIELRVLAHVSGDEGLRRAFREGLDIHRATGASVFGVPLEGVTPEMRRRAKVFNFGVLYGLTAFGLSTRERIPRAEAEAFISAYFEAYPAVAEWRERTVKEARRLGYAETLSGRRRYIPELRSTDHNRRMAAERIAINMPIQGTAADIIKIAMNRIDAELLARREAGKLARMVLQVHDELIFELPRAELDDVREIARRLMPSLPLDVPLDLDEKSGASWGEMEAAR